MGFGKPDKPAKIRSARGVVSIYTKGAEVDATGAYKPTTESGVVHVPCTLEVMSPSEAIKFGKDTDQTMYRIKLPIRRQGGADIRVTHGQVLEVTSNIFPLGERMEAVGAGHQQGRSGIQFVVARKESR